ncbi:MAG: T9SS type A sorting domain-containing protein, partial [Aliifodinibius sp.]|nr:T9SS type A sorting domain-containing protein [Fodinibius sp.]NIX00554.1 T9SS type A sorting domain-containing protein [Phycisphaerae bacterium]NIY24431.1 T9SS type A sorting domain-containing protein [Fodinibius sp.]
NAALWTDGWTALWQDLVTGIKDNKIGNGDNLPQTFAIGQNYPNPFNPSTTIQYDVAQPSKIEITVYNVQGQKVVTLVDGFKQAGSYQIRWEAVDMPSGVYFYRFTAGQTVQTKRMILLK